MKKKWVEEFSQSGQSGWILWRGRQLVTQFMNLLKNLNQIQLKTKNKKLRNLGKSFSSIFIAWKYFGKPSTGNSWFSKHIRSYLDRLLPIISNHLRTKEGAPPKFERINWLLFGISKTWLPEKSLRNLISAMTINFFGRLSMTSRYLTCRKKNLLKSNGTTIGFWNG